MNLLITIFGGMILTVVIYAAGRLGRLSNFWSAMAAGALPVFAYLAYIVRHPAGLDTVTMHVIAYPTVAVLLAMLYSPKARTVSRTHWVPKLLIGFFMIMLSVMAAFVYIASNGLPPALAKHFLPNVGDRPLHTGFAGVVEHHQDAAKGIGQHLRMEHKLARLGWQVAVTGLSQAVAGQPTAVSVRISDRDGAPVRGLAISLGLTRPGQKDGSALTLSDSPDGYQGVLTVQVPGTWLAGLHIATGTDRIDLEHALEVR